MSRTVDSAFFRKFPTVLFGMTQTLTLILLPPPSSNFLLRLDRNLFSTFGSQVVRRSELMILALISIACFSDVSNSLQAMLICARISNAFGMDAFSSWCEFRICIKVFLFSLCLEGLKWMLWDIYRTTEETHRGSEVFLQANKQKQAVICDLYNRRQRQLHLLQSSSFWWRYTLSIKIVWLTNPPPSSPCPPPLFLHLSSGWYRRRFTGVKSEVRSSDSAVLSINLPRRRCPTCTISI